MRRIACVVAVLVTPALVPAGPDAAARNELRALEGEWKVAAGEAAGKPFPKDGVPAFTVVIAADGKATGRTPEGEFRFAIAVDPGKTPKAIENRHETGEQKGKRQYGIYKLEGDRFTVCMGPPGGAEADRPKDFATRDTANAVFVFERVKAGKKP